MSTKALATDLVSEASQAAVLSTPFDDLAAVIEIHRPRVFRFLLASLRDADLAETFTQETFLRAWNSRSTFRGDCSIATWLTRIALNLVRDHTRTDRFRFWRRVSAQTIDPADIAAFLPHPDSPAESRLIATEQVAILWQTVSTLSSRQRTIFLLRFVEEMELSEIVSVTGIPLSTVKSHLYRALTRIRERHAELSRKPR
ncbi:RNA polymerase sigma factor [Edaphobacter modestus]|uniref:RNA polymerase sigma-70 factor (ECF subfamily) n=1 Tax=Edaphobacter modestus TaxID=388466 RepID=A0A4Q7YZE7_9BACT|nr:RNA polymerase sigma factor [Edaphobacter modestus]RZU42661.1 RNA polymerase sigma-70 factor (ECF subfamily) [Edaphobacter modestus]